MLKTVFRGLAAAVIFLTFQACDGPLSGYYAMNGNPTGDDIILRGCVVNDEDDKPIKGISVYIKDVTTSYAHLTNAKGEFSFYVPKKAEYNIIFTDIDGDRNGGLFQSSTGVYTYTMAQIEASSKKPLLIKLERVELEN